MTTIKIGNQDATGFHPSGDGTIVDPNAVETFINASPGLLAKIGTKADATALATKLDKTEAASTYITVAAGNATYALKTDIPPTTLDGGNASSTYGTSFNLDGGSAA